MPNLYNQFVTVKNNGVTVNTNVITEVARSPGISTESAGDIVIIDFTLTLIAGTAATACTISVFRGTAATGVNVYSPGAGTIVAGNIFSYSGSIFDQPGEVANQFYTLNVTQASATGNGTANGVVMLVQY